jgi:hypothetical protein
MAYITTEARKELLDRVAAATNRTGAALALLGQAYEQLDEDTADRLEEILFRPAQVAYGRARQAHTGFARRYGLPTRTFAPRVPLGGTGSNGHETLDRAVEAIEAADTEIAELQDSLLPVEVGDPELRAGLAEVRTLLDRLPYKARELGRTIGR